MKTIEATKVVEIPEGVTCTLSGGGRVVTIKGPRGELSKNFKHLKISLNLQNDGKTLEAVLYWSTRKGLSCLRTCTSQISNMITGVTKGYRYKMRMVYAHFPINVDIAGKDVNIRNFLGEKIVRTVSMKDGVNIVKSADVKDELVLEGNDITHVSQCAANIQQICRVRNKDIRKFLDGIYISEKGAM
jgi:large subunit ribosomal protein L9e